MNKINLSEKILKAIDTLNYLIKSNIQNEINLEKLNGCILTIGFTDINFELRVGFKKTGINVLSYTSPTESKSISVNDNCVENQLLNIQGALTSFITYVISKDVKRAMENGLVITGDPFSLKNLQNLIEHLNIDWEMFFAMHFEKSFASVSLVKQWLFPNSHKSRDLKSFFRTKQETLVMSFEDYLLHEKKLTPEKEEVENFLHTVDLLKSDIDRLLARFDAIAATVNQEVNQNEH